MGRGIAFKEQLFRVLNNKNCFGQSKYLAKKESYQNGNKGKVNGIYSKKTMSDYKTVAKLFNDWQKQRGYRFKDIKEVKELHLIEFLKERQSKGMSAWTGSRDMSALNKIFGTSLTKVSAGLTSRKMNDIKNNRGLSNNYRSSVYAKNKDIIDFVGACGVRRGSLTIITPKDFIRDEKGICYAVHVKEKGGRERNSYILSSKQVAITDFVNTHMQTNGTELGFWDKIDKNLNVHWYRAEYAENLYSELKECKENGNKYMNGRFQEVINISKLEQAVSKYGDKTKGHDTELLGIVSQSLGHNRIDVMNHYIGKFN